MGVVCGRWWWVLGGMMSLAWQEMQVMVVKCVLVVVWCEMGGGKMWRW